MCTHIHKYLYTHTNVQIYTYIRIQKYTYTHTTSPSLSFSLRFSCSYTHLTQIPCQHFQRQNMTSFSKPHAKRSKRRAKGCFQHPFLSRDPVVACRVKNTRTNLCVNKYMGTYIYVWTYIIYSYIGIHIYTYICIYICVCTVRSI